MFDSSAASPGVRWPSATAAAIAAIAATASAEDCKTGILKRTGRSRRGGIIRSRHKRRAVPSPASAISTALRVSASASPSSSASAATVALCRAPIGRPAGLPDSPLRKGRPRCFPAVLSAISGETYRKIVARSRQSDRLSLDDARARAGLDKGEQNPGDLRQRLTKIHLRMARIVPQRHADLALPQPPRQHVVLNDSDPARVAVLVAKPFEDPLRGVPLLPRPTLILQQDPVDDPGEWVELRTRRPPAPPVPGRHRKRQHLRYRPRVNPITPRPFPPAHTLNLNRITNLSVKIHTLHPPAPAAFLQRPSASGFFLRRYRTTRLLH